MKKTIVINDVKHQYYQEHKKSLLLVYPGVGYTSDKPLLYYGIQCALQHDYDVCIFGYGDIVFDKTNPLDYVMRAMRQVEAMKAHLNFSQYDHVVCLAKSIGTVIAYQTTQDIPCRYFMLTPLKEVLMFQPSNHDIFICGDRDPLVPQVHLDLLKESKAKLMMMKGNHSLETGKVLADIIQLQMIMNLFSEFIVKSE